MDSTEEGAEKGLTKKITRGKSALFSNEIFEKNRYNLSLNGQKVLFGLAQGINHELGLFEEFGIDIRGLFAYLGVEKRGDRYEIVRKALEDISRNPLQQKINDTTWSGIPWLSYEYNESESMYVKIAFSEKVKPFLIQLKGYVQIKGKYICDLTSTYATWLYPQLKVINEKYYGKYTIPVQRLKEMTYTDDPVKFPAYNTAKTANRDFLKRCLGVSKSRENGEWKIDERGPLAEINKKTDIYVNVEVLKEGNKYDRVVFRVVKKESEKKSIKKQVSPDQYRMPFASGKGGNAFGKRLNQKKTVAVSVKMSDIHSYAAKCDMTPNEYLDKAGYYQKGDWAYPKDR